VEAAVALLLPKADMAGLHVLVTAGPTQERLDPVRYLTNDSSGKMGYALAEAARDRGADVTLVSGPVCLPPPQGVEIVAVETTQDLYEVMLRLCGEQDLIAQAAAPADYRFAAPSGEKLKKQEGKPLTLEMVENPDVAKAVGERKRPGQVLIGFAAETNDLLVNARKKLQSKGLDLVVANDVTQEGAGFGVDTNIVTLVSKGGELSLPKLSKRTLADRIWDEALAIARVP
jgi:phosphopantothenoylcysteine decarboxylase/phosphopantothenate--cysteine ligase